MLTILIYSLLPLVFALFLGWSGARVISLSLRQYLIKKIGYVIWILLVSVGYEFGSVLANPLVGRQVCLDAFLYASILSLTTFFLLFTQKKRVGLIHASVKKELKDIWPPIIECICAISMVVLGVLLYSLFPQVLVNTPLTTYLLYIVIVLIGIDLASIKIERFTFGHIYVPLMVILTLFIAAFFTSYVLDYKFSTLMMVGSGFGWFSLSGSLVAKLTTNELGSFALLTDLIRELYAIILLYIFGQYRSHAVIGVCGATAMDSTLPFVKKNCSDLDVQIAIFSGFILTILAPFFITFFASFR